MVLLNTRAKRNGNLRTDSTEFNVGIYIYNIYLLQLGCYPVSVVILHVYKT